MAKPIHPLVTHPATALDRELFAAIEAGDVAGVDKALIQGASLLSLNGEDLTPLQMAAMRESAPALMRLMAQVEDPRMLAAPQVQGGMSIMDIAVAASDESKACAIALVESGRFDPASADMLGNFARAVAAGMEPLVAAFAGKFDLAERLFMRGSGKAGMTALEIAAMVGQASSVEILLRGSTAEDPPGHFASALALCQRHGVADATGAAADLIRGALAMAERGELGESAAAPRQGESGRLPRL